jgi:hypothetical protein
MMLSQFSAKLVAASFALILCVVVLHAWRADRRDRAQLAAELSATKQLLATADARQRNRDAQLAQTLSALDAQKRSIVTPDQIVRQLLEKIPLPAPIALQSTPQDTDDRRGTIYRAPTSPTAEPAAASPTPTLDQQSEPLAVIPATDLKPLYDFTLNCQACQAKLSVAQNDLADEKSKTAALTKERDDAVRIAKGGSAWRRVTRAAKWFLLGAAAGAIAAKSTR